MDKEHRKPTQNHTAPLNATNFMILLSLARGPLHGYAIMQAVETASNGRVRIGLGSLYRFIARLTASGLIEETEAADAGPHAGKKRRTYRLTDAGRQAASHEAQRLRDVVALAAEQLLADDRP